MKNTLNISIDMEPMENRLDHRININIHTLVDGKMKEQFDMDVYTDKEIRWKLFWEKIGERIEQHMRDNPEYNPFGS